MIPKIETNKIVALPTKAELLKYWDTQTNFNKILKKKLEIGMTVWFSDQSVVITGFTEDGSVKAFYEGVEAKFNPSNLKVKKK